MVETTPLHPDTFLSNSDKHRGTHFPSITSDDVCLETGIDVGDGTHVVYKPGIRHLSYTYSGTVDSSVHPTTGFSLRISGEGDIRRWVASCSVAKPSPDFEILGLEPTLRMPIKTLPASVRRPVAGRYFSWGPLERPIVQRLPKALSRKGRSSYPVHTA